MIKILSLLCALFAVSFAQIRAGVLTPGEQIWPRPKSFSMTESGFNLHISEFQFVVDSATPSGHILHAFTIYKELIPVTAEGQKVTVVVSCGNCEKDSENIRNDITTMGLEDYKIEVKADGEITATASNYLGVVRALQTLSQLSVDGIIAKVPVSISDAPTYRYRGLMIDTARHYLLPSTIKKVIDGMAASKLNVMHWHLVDGDSFPLYLESAPQLAEYGAYRTFEGELKIYNKAMIHEIINYAILRGVVVIPEIDMPGHTYAWNLSPKWEGVVACPDMNSPQVLAGQLDPRVPRTFDVIKLVLEETLEIFKDTPIFHVGFDEAKPDCWNVTQAEANKMMVELFDYANKILKDASGGQVLVAHWDDMVGDGVYDKDKSVVQIWHGLDYLKPTIEKTQSYAVISSLGQTATEGIYLDCGYGQYLDGTTKSWCDPRKAWRDIYDFKVPSQYAGNDRILGGEAAMWSELVDDTNIESRVFPRASALAEMLWTSDEQKEASNPFARIIQHRNLLMGRGIRAQPLQPKICQIQKGKGRDGACHPYS